MHGLFVPEEKERQRNSKALVFGRFSQPRLQYLLQQKRSIHAARPGGFRGSSSRPRLKLFSFNGLLHGPRRPWNSGVLHQTRSKTKLCCGAADMQKAPRVTEAPSQSWPEGSG